MKPSVALRVVATHVSTAANAGAPHGAATIPEVAPSRNPPEYDPPVRRPAHCCSRSGAAAAHSSDVFPVSAPQRLLQWAGRLTGGSYSGVFLLGATSGIVAAPCGAPAFAAVLTWVATTRSATLGFIYLFVFSLGMTALLVVVGLFSGTLAALPQAGSWTLWIKKVAGVALLAMAEYYFVQMGTVL